MALNSIGTKYQKGLGINQDYHKAMKFYSQSAELGYPEAYFNIDLMYHEGIGATKDYLKGTEVGQIRPLSFIGYW